jgi:hypothetical protein
MKRDAWERWPNSDKRADTLLCSILLILRLKKKGKYLHKRNLDIG